MTPMLWKHFASESEKWLSRERYNHDTVKEEHIDYTEYTSFDDASQQLAHWLEVEYMTRRIHSALGYLTPAEFEASFVQHSHTLFAHA